MGEHKIIIYLVVVLLSVVQSVFGVGLLVFGTPFLLILGVPFGTALSLLLPCSLVISVLQVGDGWRDIGTFKRHVPLYVLPFVALGVWIVFAGGGKTYDTKIYIGLILILTGLVRLSRNFQNLLGDFFAKYVRVSFAVIGMIHGLTNLGGGLLTVMASSIFMEKRAIRANIAYGYLLMAASQIATLFLLGKFAVGLDTLLLPSVSFLTCLLLGNRVFKITKDEIYYHVMTAVILFCGISLILHKIIL